MVLNNTEASKWASMTIKGKDNRFLGFYSVTRIFIGF